MFGFQGGEDNETFIRKRGYLKDAQQRWSFLTYYDLSTIKTKGQLCNMVKVRASLTEDQATKDVETWMRGKQF